MFITPDVIFHENDMFFGSFESSLQEEYRDSKVLTLDYFPVISNELHEKQQLQPSYLEPMAHEEQQRTIVGDQQDTEQQPTN